MKFVLYSGIKKRQNQHAAQEACISAPYADAIDGCGEEMVKEPFLGGRCRHRIQDRGLRTLGRMPASGFDRVTRPCRR
jgi:hypothetical protein